MGYASRKSSNSLHFLGLLKLRPQTLLSSYITNKAEKRRFSFPEYSYRIDLAPKHLAALG